MSAPYEKLEAWKLAHDLALKVYRLTAKFPPSERYGLTSQLRRAAAGVPTNLVEGNARGRRGEYIRFCHIARGSAVETRYLLRLSHDLGFLPQGDFGDTESDFDRLGAILHGLINGLESSRKWK